MLILKLFFMLGTAWSANVNSSIFQSGSPKINLETWKVSGSLAVGSDCVVRGQTVTEHRPSVQAELDMNHPSGLYASVWGANISYPDVNAKSEFDWSGGYSKKLNDDWTAQIGAVYASFHVNEDLSTLEIPLQVSWRAVKISTAWSPHFGGTGQGPAWYFSAEWSPLFEAGYGLNFGAGYSVFTGPLSATNYGNFKGGVFKELWGFNWDLSGYFVDHRQFNGFDDPRAVVTVTKNL